MGAAARALLLSVGLAIALAPSAAAAATPRWAQDGGWLSKQHAQHGASSFARQIGPLLDPDAPGHVTVHVARPSKCHRRDRSTVLCWFSVHLVSQPVTRTGFMRVHLQRNRFLGYKLPWDPARVGLS